MSRGETELCSQYRVHKHALNALFTVAHTLGSWRRTLPKPLCDRFPWDFSWFKICLFWKMLLPLSFKVIIGLEVHKHWHSGSRDLKQTHTEHWECFFRPYKENKDNRICALSSASVRVYATVGHLEQHCCTFFKIKMSHWHNGMDREVLGKTRGPRLMPLAYYNSTTQTCKADWDSCLSFSALSRLHVYSLRLVQFAIPIIHSSASQCCDSPASASRVLTLQDYCITLLFKKTCC